MDIKTQYEIIINSKTLIIKGLRDNAISYEIVIRHPPSAPYIFVSIHAPVWGATISGGNSADLTQVSIHAPVWGAT